MANFNLTSLDHSDNAAIRAYPGYSNGKSMTARLKKGDYQSLRYDHCFAQSDPEEVIAYALTCLTDASMMDIEKKEASKIGPFNRDPFDAWKDKVYAYYEPTNWTPNEAWLAMATDRLFRELRAQTDSVLMPLSLDVAITDATHNKNLGMPFGCKQWRDEEGVYYPHMVDYVARAQKLIEGDPSEICVSILGHRSQPGGMTTVKNRPMMMADHAETFAALTLQRPLMPVLKKVPAFCGFLKYEDLQEAMGPLFNMEGVHGISYGDDAVLVVNGKFYSLDYEQFDATCKKQLMSIVLQDVIKPLFDQSAGPLVDALLEIYVNNPLWTPEGVMRGEHGLFSGVTLTSIIGTMVNRLFFHYLVVSGRIDENFNAEVIQATAQELGLKMNPLKQFVSDTEFDFCQRRYSRDFRHGKFSVMRTLGRCIFQEGWIQKQDAADELGVSMEELDMTSVVLLRIMVKLENAKYHPDHKWLVGYVREHEDHQLDTELVSQAHKLKKLVRSRVESDCGLLGFTTFKIVKALEEAGSAPVTTKHKDAKVKQETAKLEADNKKLLKAIKHAEETAKAKAASEARRAEKARKHEEAMRAQQEAAKAKKAERARVAEENNRNAEKNRERKSQPQAANTQAKAKNSNTSKKDDEAIKLLQEQNQLLRASLEAILAKLDIKAEEVIKQA